MVSDQTRYSRLANITKIINTKLELREVLQRVTMAISEEIVRCDAVGIYLPQEDGTFRGFAGKPETINGVTLDTQVIDPEIDLLAKEVIKTKKTIYIPDTSKDHRPDPRPVDAFKIKSLLALPISFGQELFGLVFLFDYGIPMNLTDSEIQSVEAYVNMAAVAIQNANNLKQKESLIAEKQLLLNVTRDLSMCSSIQESFDKCFFYLEQILESKNMTAHLLDPLDKTTIKTTKLSKGCDWTEADWTEKSYEAKIQEVIQIKNIDSKGLLMIPLVSMGEVLGVIVVGKEGKVHNYDHSQLQLAKSIVDATAPTFSNLLYMDQLESIVEERTRELAAANEKVTSVIECITDGFFILNNKWEFTYVNKHQYFPQRKTAKDVLGKNIWDVFPSEIDTIMYEEFHRAMSERTTVHFEFLSTADEYWHEVIAYPYDDGICCIFKNITEKKKYEQELKRLSNIDLIGQMAAGISHEIRNPMTTVLGFLQLLKEENIYEKHNKYFHLMIEELNRANSIITEFLSMGNTRKLDLQMLDLNSIIRDIIPLIKVDTHNQNKYIQVDTNDIPELLLNRNEIRQLLMNLYRNGLEAMSTGKVLTISTYKEGQNCVVLAVRDQGKGIRPEVLEKLGTPFYTTKENGTGLGLGICYAIAARHNAKVEIQTGSEGTTFFVKFDYKNNKK
ncbi:TPA: ATP-binding protein [Bacillus thuringiensis]|uniref:GAF domain-containing sensor histidine kinase n=1 Tax=Bacillus thuringiensis TaxID=1428 RepID=UPI00103E99AA|nr:ATP-binding protein [Bacillus thuringiensis]HDR4764616.1 GAF domain-containing protein [Bacillus cereus]TBX44598.1 GAF domain-containing protein [Bacillus thuringiensis]HDR4797726.1 GAF domain-containing protein [Bacillus cereus]HDR4803814.1 GAF domain-containing protein [Bacillus cereus]HDR4809822.1 GAF domain-containing protein [Bacillus cereus]